MTEAGSPSRAGSVNRTRTLLLVPTTVGLAGVSLAVVTGVVAGVTDGSQGLAATAVAAAAIGVTVVTGGSYGLYLGLAILAVGGLVADGGPTRVEVTTLAVLLLAVHEVVRFSLDGRRPSRFGPGVLVGYGTRLVLAAIVVAAAATAVNLATGDGPLGGPLGGPVGDRSLTNVFIPIGLAAAAIPLYVRQWGYGTGRTIRVAAVAVLTVGVVTLAALGAAVREQTLQNPGPAPEAAAPVTTTTTIGPDDGDQESAAADRSLPGWVVVLGVAALVTMVYFILRRDEAIFELDDVERRVEEGTAGAVVGGSDQQQEEEATVDEDTLAAMLRDLQLDLWAEADPGRAIRFGYAKIEQQFGQQRLARAPSETEREFLVRAAPRLGSAGPAFTTLTRLFEAARFGHLPVTEAMRHDGLAAVDTLLTELAAEPGDHR